MRTPPGAANSLDNLANCTQGIHVGPSESFPGTVSRTRSDRDLLRAISELVRADQAMRRSLSRRMTVGESDLRAMRFVMAEARVGHSVTPHDLADHLGITTAATTTLLDRLSAAGHVDRAPHPTDRRSKVVVATEHAYDEVGNHLATTHDRMRAAAARVPASVRPDIIAFLDDLCEVMRS